MYKFQIYAQVLDQGALVNGAGYSQIKAGHSGAPGMRWISLAAAAAGRGHDLPAEIALLFAPGDRFLGAWRSVFSQPRRCRSSSVGPDELSKETPYIGWSIENTRAAYRT